MYIDISLSLESYKEILTVDLFRAQLTCPSSQTNQLNSESLFPIRPPLTIIMFPVDRPGELISANWKHFVSPF